MIVPRGEDFGKLGGRPTGIISRLSQPSHVGSTRVIQMREALRERRSSNNQKDPTGLVPVVNKLHLPKSLGGDRAQSSIVNCLRPSCPIINHQLAIINPPTS
jgi:hypothetical protein